MNTDSMASDYVSYASLAVSLLSILISLLSSWLNYRAEYLPDLLLECGCDEPEHALSVRVTLIGREGVWLRRIRLVYGPSPSAAVVCTAKWEVRLEASRPETYTFAQEDIRKQCRYMNVKSAYGSRIWFVIEYNRNAEASERVVIPERLLDSQLHPRARQFAAATAYLGLESLVPEANLPIERK